MEKLKNIFENHGNVALAYHKLITAIVWEDNDFMKKYSITSMNEIQTFVEKYIEKNAEKDILAIMENMLSSK